MRARLSVPISSKPERLDFSKGYLEPSLALLTSAFNTCFGKWECAGAGGFKGPESDAG